MIEAALQQLPAEYRPRFRALLDQAPQAPGVVRAEVEEYLATIRQVGALMKNFDLPMAERLSTTALALLEHAQGMDPAPIPEQLAQAAARYFILEEEDEEITGVLGFDDDIQVLNAVSQALGRPELVIPFRRA